MCVYLCWPELRYGGVRLRLRRLFGTIATSSPFQKKLTITFMIPLMAGRHLYPSAKLSVSSQWLSQDISLFLHEISLSLEISVQVQVSSIFKEKQNSLGGTSRNRSRSIGSAVQHFNPYTTEDLLTMDALIWIYIATTLTLTLTLTLCTNH